MIHRKHRRFCIRYYVSNGRRQSRETLGLGAQSLKPKPPLSPRSLCQEAS